VIQGGNPPVLATLGLSTFNYAYFDPNITPETFDGVWYRLFNRSTEPATVTGNEIVYWSTLSPEQNPIKVWELLAGQGRVRRAPEVEFDTPSSFVDGVSNYDEGFGFNGNPVQNDWTYIGKQEMLTPYNNNKIYQTTTADFHGPKFPLPSAIRWELLRAFATSWPDAACISMKIPGRPAWLIPGMQAAACSTPASPPSRTSRACSGRCTPIASSSICKPGTGAPRKVISPTPRITGPGPTRRAQPAFSTRKIWRPRQPTDPAHRAKAVLSKRRKRLRIRRRRGPAICNTASRHIRGA
jgi:hypothetical protein